MEGEKPIIATTLSGLFINSAPWYNSHGLWFEEKAEELNDPSILEWIEKPDYFEGVDLVMQIAYPHLSEEERTIKARESFFESVCRYVKENPVYINEEVVEYFKSIKGRYKIALLTTNTTEAVNKMIHSAHLQGIFDIIETSFAHEKDDKSLVFARFIKNHGKPVLYIGGNRRDSYAYCADHKIPSVFFNLETDEEIAMTKNIHSLEELKEVIDNIGK